MALPKLETPKYHLTVPSTGQEIEFRPYVVKEEKILMMAMESNDQKQMLTALMDMIETCTFGKIKARDLATFDLEYLFMQIRSKAAGETSKVGLKCSKCEHANEIEINTAEVKVQGNVKKDEKVMLNDELGIVLKYPTVKALQKQLSGGEVKQTDVVTTTIVSSIDSIFDNENVWPAVDQTPEELEDFIDSLPSEVFQKLLPYFEDMPKLSHDIAFNCKSCGEKNQTKLEGLQSFF